MPLVIALLKGGKRRREGEVWLTPKGRKMTKRNGKIVPVGSGKRAKKKSNASQKRQQAHSEASQKTINAGEGKFTHNGYPYEVIRHKADPNSVYQEQRNVRYSARSDHFDYNVETQPDSDPKKVHNEAQSRIEQHLRLKNLKPGKFYKANKYQYYYLDKAGRLYDINADDSRGSWHIITHKDYESSRHINLKNPSEVSAFTGEPNDEGMRIYPGDGGLAAAKKLVKESEAHYLAKQAGNAKKDPLTEKMEEVKAKIANDKDGSNQWTTEERYRFVKNPDKNVFDQVPYQVSKHEQSFEVRDEKGRKMGYFVSIHHPTNEGENYQVYGLQLRGGRSFGAGFKPPFANLKTLEQAKAAALEKIAQMKKKIHANAAKHNGVYVTGKKRG